MQCSSFEEAVDLIILEDSRYDRDAYGFVRETLDYAAKMPKKTPDTPKPRHITGRELLECVRSYAMEEFGPIAKRVLNTWGIKRTEDIGEIVFNLVNKGVLGKQESDKKDDFAGGFDFEESFVRPFLPESIKNKTVKPRRPRGKSQRTSLSQ